MRLMGVGVCLQWAGCRKWENSTRHVHSHRPMYSFADTATCCLFCHTRFRTLSCHRTQPRTCVARTGHDEDEKEELAERKRVAQKDAKKKAKRRKANGSFLDV